jgi:hypothetical protein
VCRCTANERLICRTLAKICLEIDVHAHVSLITAVNEQGSKEASMIMVEEISGCLLRKGVEGWDLWDAPGQV